MRLTRLLWGSCLFAVGVLVGFLMRDALREDDPRRELRASLELEPSPTAEISTPGDRAPEERSVRDRRFPRDAERSRESGPAGDGRSGADALAALAEALASGDDSAVVDATRELLELPPGALAGGALSPETVEALAARLAASSVEDADILARALIVHGGPTGVELIAGMACEPGAPPERCHRLLHALLETPKEHRALAATGIEGLLTSSAPDELRHDAARVYGRLWGEQGVEALLRLAADPDRADAATLYEAVGDVGELDDVDTLFELLPSARGREREGLLRAVGRIAAREGHGDGLLELLRAPPPGTSPRDMARAIADAAPSLETSALTEALKSSVQDPRALEPLAHALARRGGPDALRALLDVASGPLPRGAAGALAHALAEFRGPEAVPALAELLRASGEEEGVEPLARALARHRSDEALSELLRVLDGESPAWRRRAVAHALEESGPESLSPDELLARLRGEPDREVARALGDTFRRLHPGVAEERSLELFESAATSSERAALARLLEQRRDPEALDGLADQLARERDDRTRWELARVLGRGGDGGVARAEAVLDATPDEDRRHAVLWGLEAAGRPPSPALRELFVRVATRDRSPSLRAQAVEILGRAEGAAAAPELQALLETEQHPEVRERIERALADLGSEPR